MSKNNDGNTKLVSYTLRMPLETHTKFKTRLTSERKNMRDVIMDMIMDYLSKAEYSENKHKKDP